MASNSDVLATKHSENMSKWTMDGMHRRRLSLLDKWTRDKSMAIGYLRRQRAVITWIESVLKCELSSICLVEALKSGVVLREMMELFFPNASNCMPPINRNYAEQVAPWKERENISVFLRLCKSIGINDLSLFCTDDLYEGADMMQVLFCLEHLKMIVEDQTAHRSKWNEPTKLSNQELQLEMSDMKRRTTASECLISSGSSEKVAIHDKESVTREASEVNSVLLRYKKYETVEPAKVPDEKVIDECNQVSEDKPEGEDPADGDNVSFNHNIGDVSDEHHAAEGEGSFILLQTTNGNLPFAFLGMKGEDEKIIARSLAKQDVYTIEKDYKAPMGNVTTAAIRGATTELATDLMPDTKADNDDQLNCKSKVPAAGRMLERTAESGNKTNVDNEVTPGPDFLTAVLVESTSAENVTSAQSSAENAKEAVAEQDSATLQPTEEEVLEAKTMVKCSCGWCTTM